MVFSVEQYTKELEAQLKELLVQESQIKAVTYQLKSSSLVLTMGNGGSASTAQHLAQGLCNAGVRAICLTDNTSLLTALSNDEGYSEALAWQVKLFSNELNIACILISASGDSPNILEAAKVANTEQMRTIGLIGFGGGKLRLLVDYPIVFSSKDYGVVEDIHLTVCHLLCRLVRNG